MASQKGQAAIIGIMALAIVGLIVAVAIAAMALQEYQMTDDATKGNEVFTAVESVMSDTLVRIKKNPDWPSGLPYSEGPNNLLNGVETEVLVEESDDNLIISVNGNKSGISRELQAVFHTDSGNVNVVEISP